LFDHEKDGLKKNSLILIGWVPMRAPARSKFSAATAFQNIKNSTNISKCINCDDITQLDEKSISAFLK
jgi:hypothetical protein